MTFQPLPASALASPYRYGKSARGNFVADNPLLFHFGIPAANNSNILCNSRPFTAALAL